MKLTPSLRLRPPMLVAAALAWLALLAPERSTPKALAPPSRSVFVVGGLSDDDLTTFSVCLASARPDAVLLIDSPLAASANRRFLAEYQPTAVVPVGSFSGGLDERLGVRAETGLEWDGGVPPALFGRAEQVVVCPARPRPLFLHAALLAGVLRAPLFVLRGGAGEADALARRLTRWETRTVVAVGSAADFCKQRLSVDTKALPELADVIDACLRAQQKSGAIRNLVLANPADLAQKHGRMSVLAPWLAAQKRAALLLTNDSGSDASDQLRCASRKKELADADCVLIAASLQAIPVEKRADPAGEEGQVELEPGAPMDDAPFSFATGRLFHDDPALVALILARQRLLAQREGQPLKAFVVSNTTGRLPLLEIFSRHTVHELRNQGVRTTALLGAETDPYRVRRLLPEQDIFLWEGHHKTLTEEFGFLKWNEPLRPSLFFMQTCMALREEETSPLLRRGAVAVVGSSTRTFSATGGAFSLAFFDALLYDEQTLGGSLRQAKNFLLAYSLLKKKRFGSDAELSGANLRSAWAFTLWGDPTLTFPRPPRPARQREPIRHRVLGDRLVVSLPSASFGKVQVDNYEAQMLPNARLAGLLTVSPEDEDARRVLPFVFTEVHLPDAPPGRTPALSSKIPAKNWVFCWDAQRRTGYLLVRPRAKDRTELSFRIRWEERPE